LFLQEQQLEAELSLKLTLHLCIMLNTFAPGRFWGFPKKHQNARGFE